MKNFSFCMLAFILFSCSGKKAPPDIIQPKEMQIVLWDVIRAQALSAEIVRKDSTISEVAETKMLTRKVFEIHNITASVFDQSYAWYTSHPEMMRVIFDSMNNQNQRRNEVRLKEGYKQLRSDPRKKLIK